MLRVLIADDEPSVVESLKASIDWEKYDLQVAAVAHNGKEAKEILETTPIDIAILDIRMPGYSGLELCRWLHERNSEIQMIVISGYAEFSYAQKALRYGVAGYCLKPVEYAELTFLLIKAGSALEKRDLLYTRCDRLLDAVEDGDEEAASLQMREMGLDPACCHVAVSIGDQPLPTQGLPVSVLRLGRGQYAYLSPQRLDPLLPQEGEPSEPLLGVGALKKPA